MRSRWNDAEAAAAVAHWRGVAPELALRIYTSRLIGGDPALVLHGGGNTSVKSTARDLFGAEIRVLHVKGSGHDLADIGPAGLPAVELAPLLRLRDLPSLADEAMVNAVRSRLLDSRAPDPSVETLLHAFLPWPFVDHTHADAILALTDQPDGESLARQALGPDVAILSWVMPGFPLAKAVAAAVEAQPGCTAVVLCKHGAFTFGATARESYERMIAVVDAAERFLRARAGSASPLLAGGGALPGAARREFLARALPVVRGALAWPLQRTEGERTVRIVADARLDDDLAAFAAAPAAAELCRRGPATPDHALRTKGHYLFLRRDQALDPTAVRAAVGDYVRDYAAWHRTHAPALGNSSMLVPTPMVAVIEGCGVVGVTPSRKASAICADIAEHTLRTIAVAEAVGRYQPLSPAELFEMEYWPLERKKLAAVQPLPLAGQVALVTGAAGAIGCGIAEVLLEQGACVFATDVDAQRLQIVRERLGKRHGKALCTGVADLCVPEQVERLFADCVLSFGGVDCVVPNAGIAHVSSLAEMDPARFARVLEVNATGTMLVLKAAAAVFSAQQTGGTVVVQASKNAFAPGAGFGAYSASKAATLQLMRVAALEMAPLGVQVNAINADAVFGDEVVPSQLWETVGPERMRARNLDPAGLRQFYRDRSLLKRTVTPRHVGEAVAFFAAAKTPTTGAVLPVDGGLPEAFPR
ncbi:MAG: bifunctional aldolase/short-chain dehydrogenase [Planctomycetes bacterium]|nr:bifunctional aldolase/short-chain dehydrogenase [Planctomycetota bacterium]